MNLDLVMPLVGLAAAATKRSAFETSKLQTSKQLDMKLTEIRILPLPPTQMYWP
jgi:hypothetical protein